MATEDIPEDQKVRRIFNRQIFRALGAEDIRHRPVASRDILFRRMILADYGLTIALYPGLAPGAVAPLRYRVARPANLPSLGVPKSWHNPKKQAQHYITGKANHGDEDSEFYFFEIFLGGEEPFKNGRSLIYASQKSFQLSQP